MLKTAPRLILSTGNENRAVVGKLCHIYLRIYVFGLQEFSGIDC